MDPVVEKKLAEWQRQAAIADLCNLISVCEQVCEACRHNRGGWDEARQLRRAIDRMTNPVQVKVAE